MGIEQWEWGKTERTICVCVSVYAHARVYVYHFLDLQIQKPKDYLWEKDYGKD